MEKQDKPIRVDALIALLKKLPKSDRVMWCDALGNNGYVYDATIGEKDGEVELHVIESEESYANHSL